MNFFKLHSTVAPSILNLSKTTHREFCSAFVCQLKLGYPVYPHALVIWWNPVDVNYCNNKFPQSNFFFLSQTFIFKLDNKISHRSSKYNTEIYNSQIATSCSILLMVVTFFIKGKRMIIKRGERRSNGQC